MSTTSNPAQGVEYSALLTCDGIGKEAKRALLNDLFRARDGLRTDYLEALDAISTLHRQLAAERAIKAELVAALDNALNCMVPTGEDTRTDRAIVRGEAALARAKEVQP